MRFIQTLNPQDLLPGTELYHLESWGQQTQRPHCSRPLPAPPRMVQIGGEGAYLLNPRDLEDT